MSTKTNSESSGVQSEEKAPGGLRYDVILAEPVAEKPESSKESSPFPKNTTAEEIQRKLEQAEERRKSVSACRMSFIVDQLSKLEDASRKREEKTNAFIASTQTALGEKLDASSSNREAYLNGLKAKVTDHLNNVEGVRKQVDAQTEELRSAIQTKLKSAEENREESLRKMLEKLKDHEERVQRVRLGHEEAIKQLEERIQSKLVIAETKRETERLKKIENLREHSSKINEAQETLSKKAQEEQEAKLARQRSYEEKVRKIDQEKEARRQEISLKISGKLESAQENRNKVEEKFKKEVQDKIEAKLELADKKRAEKKEQEIRNKQEQDRRAELVRANKGRLTTENETNASG